MPVALQGERSRVLFHTVDMYTCMYVGTQLGLVTRYNVIVVFALDTGHMFASTNRIAARAGVICCQVVVKTSDT